LQTIVPPLISYDNGIAIEGLDFLLDPGRTADFAFVSHAHFDHARKHGRILTTAETALLYRQRFPSVPTRVLPFGRRVKFGDATVELFPSGHMLGAAQILVEVDGTRIIYTGDFKVYPNLTCPPLETRRCDVLIMESTYGDPSYSFPPQNEVYVRIISFVKRAFADRNVPVLIGYAMGKSQEAVMLMQQHGFDVCVDTPVSKMCQLYRVAGVNLKPTSHYQHTSLEGKVVVVSPQTTRNDEFRQLKRKRSLFLTGWSVGKKKGFVASADGGLPLSDHADYTQLLAYVDECRPSKILTLHGDARFAELLRDLGFDAEYLTKGYRSDQPSATHPLASEPDDRRQRKGSTAETDTTIGQNYELF
jgi:Cft2 family RNA processing exonuclease